MPTPITILLIVLGALVAFVAFLVVRGMLFRPEAIEREKVEPVHINVDKAVSDLSEMIRCRTISDKCKENEDEAEFKRFKALLPTLFPSVFEKCAYEDVSDRAILIRWEGRSHLNPTVLMAHYDVVSVDEQSWERPPFSGVVENGVMWGRGTLDTKGTLNGALQAAESLIQTGFVPENDIYFAFSGGEEVNGKGASNIVDYFEKNYPEGQCA